LVLEVVLEGGVVEEGVVEVWEWAGAWEEDSPPQALIIVFALPVIPLFCINVEYPVIKQYVPTAGLP
jgi:hypothetical protein